MFKLVSNAITLCYYFFLVQNFILIFIQQFHMNFQSNVHVFGLYFYLTSLGKFVIYYILIKCSRDYEKIVFIEQRDKAQKF